MIELIPREPRLNIHPGEWYFGNEYDSLYTVLGSCVALSVWHPTLKLGGLCHYLLARQPGRISKQELLRDESAGRYANTILKIMKQTMLRYAALSEYQLGLFGGCDAFLNTEIGKQNVAYAQQWLQEHQLSLTHNDVGGSSSRSLLLELASGSVELKHYEIQNFGAPYTP